MGGQVLEILEVFKTLLGCDTGAKGRAARPRRSSPQALPTALIPAQTVQTFRGGQSRGAEVENTTGGLPRLDTEPRAPVRFSTWPGDGPGAIAVIERSRAPGAIRRRRADDATCRSTSCACQRAFRRAPSGSSGRDGSARPTRRPVPPPTSRGCRQRRGRGRVFFLCSRTWQTCLRRCSGNGSNTLSPRGAILFHKSRSRAHFLSKSVSRHDF